MSAAGRFVPDPLVLEVVRRREIATVFHFTTNIGLIGTFASKALKSRALLDQDLYLEHLFTANNPIRKDPSWVDYVSLSISRINTEHFEYSRRNHLQDDLWWCVVQLDPEVLCHPGVVFVTANNIWPRAIRGTGHKGLDALFAPSVPGKYDAVHRRHDGMSPAWTTCDQAEVLYPAEIPSSYLLQIIVQNDLHAADVEAGLGATGHPDVPITVDAELFVRGVISR